MMIERRWVEATAGKARLFNASKYRLAGQRLEAGRLELRVGLTDYKAQSSLQSLAEILSRVAPIRCLITCRNYSFGQGGSILQDHHNTSL